MASDKSISSRLLTMKFMQRGIANSPTASPSAKHNQQQQHQHQQHRSSKRQRLSATGTAAPRHSDADVAALQAAIADEEARRAELMERVAAEKGDTRWVLSVRRPRTVPGGGGGSSGDTARALDVAVAGFADIDESGSGSESGEEAGMRAVGGAARRSYGQVRPSATADDDLEANSEDDSDEEYDPSSIDAMIAEAKSDAVQSKKRFSDDRMPTSISGGGGSSNRNTPKKSFLCYKCGKEGHVAKLCPNR